MNKVLCGIYIVLMSLVVLTVTAMGAPPTKVLILPPVLHGSPDMAYLQQGVVDMLSTRLSAPDQMVVLASGDNFSKTELDQAGALASGRKINADYAIFGSLTLLGGGISTDLSIVEIKDGRLALTFSRSGKDHASLISHMDQFSIEVKRKILGVSPSLKTPVTAGIQTKTAAPDSDPTYQHPEKLLSKPIEGQELAGNGLMMVHSDFGSAQGKGTMWGPRIADQVQGVALGDVTGDNRLESIYVGRHSVWIYRYIQGRFAKMAHIKGSGNYVGVDTADLDADGRDEIFVTSVDDTDGRLISFVLVYNGRTFERRAELLSYYFRAVNWPGRGRILLGQRQGFDTFFTPGIFEIEYKGGKYRKASRMKVARKLNLYGLGLGEFSEAKDQKFVVFSDSRHLQLLNPGGKLNWNSSEHYGGNAALIQKQDSEVISKDSMRFMPARIEVIDLDRDGIDEVVVMRNEESTGTLLGQTRSFKNGRIEVLKAEGVGLTPYKRTRKMHKYISDFALADIDGDGNMEIVTAVVRQAGSALSNGQSRICIFNMSSNDKKSKQPQTVQ